MELDVINTYLGGHSVTICGFKKLLRGNGETIVCEIGCGGGDNLIAIKKWCHKKKINACFTGVDINPGCIAFAEEKDPDLTLIVSDFRSVQFGSNPPHIIFSSLFCHHFTNEELVDMLLWMRKNSLTGFFINDLHRHPVAYFLIKLVTRLFSRSHFIKNDAPLSVAKGFTKNEWKKILQKAGITKYTIQWKWAFRYLIVVHNERQ